MEIYVNRYDLGSINTIEDSSGKSNQYSKNQNNKIQNSKSYKVKKYLSKSQKTETLNKKPYLKERQNLYKKQLYAISSFFNVSNSAAKYMYHRRRKGLPYKKNDDFNFLPWTIQLQNALVKADTVPEWDWENLTFYSDCETLKYHCIDIDSQPITLYKNKPNTFNKPQLDADDWTLVSSSKKKISHKFLLRQMGFLLRHQHIGL